MKRWVNPGQTMQARVKAKKTPYIEYDRQIDDEFYSISTGLVGRHHSFFQVISLYSFFWETQMPSGTFVNFTDQKRAAELALSSALPVTNYRELAKNIK